MTMSRGAILLLAMLAALWLLLTDGALSSWIIGLPAVLGAYWAIRVYGSAVPARLSLSGLMHYLPFFLWQSVRGGVDVARRVLSPRMPIAPGFVDYPIRLQHEPARLLFANSVSLLPGTLSADLRGSSLHVHVLDRHSDVDAELLRVELATGRVFGEVL